MTPTTKQRRLTVLLVVFSFVAGVSIGCLVGWNVCAAEKQHTIDNLTIWIKSRDAQLRGEDMPRLHAPAPPAPPAPAN